MYDELIGELYIVASGVQSKRRRELLVKAANAIEELQEDNAAMNGTVSNIIGQIAELRRPRWIPISARLPECGVAVLVCTFNGFVEVAMYTGGEWDAAWDFSEICAEITHWMPLPPLPETRKEEV